MSLELYKDAVLTDDFPKNHLKRGDVVRLVDRHTAPDGTEGFSIEVFNAMGHTIATATVPVAALEPLRSDEVLCVRQVG